MYSQSLHGWLIANKQTYLFYTRCAIQVQFLIVREIYKIIIEWVQNEYKKTVNEKENKTQMNLDMTQFGATQNQKQAQARTLLWGKHIKFQPCLAGARVRSSEHKVMDRSFYYIENDRDISRFSRLRKLWTMDTTRMLRSVWWVHYKSDNCIQG